MYGKILAFGPRRTLSELFGSPPTGIRVEIAENEIRLTAESKIAGLFGLVVISGWFREAPISSEIVDSILRDFHCPIIGTSNRELVREHLMKLGCHEVYPRSEVAEQSYSILELWRRLIRESQGEPEDLCRIVTKRATQLQTTFIDALGTISSEIEEDKIIHDNKIVLAASLRGDYNEYS